TFSLSPREERAGRELERGAPDEQRPPLHGPLLLFGEEREKRSAAGAPSKHLPNRIDHRRALRRHGRGVGWVAAMMPGRSDSRAVLKSGLFLAKSSTSLRASAARPVRRRRSERSLTASKLRGQVSMARR